MILRMAGPFTFKSRSCQWNWSALPSVFFQPAVTRGVWIWTGEPTKMSSLHIEEVEMDRYAMGVLSEPLLPAFEEHLLGCSTCQSRLSATDDFVRIFRAAATQLETRPVPFWSRILRARGVLWAGAAALAALSLVFVETQPRNPSMPPAMVLMQSLRGPEA